MIKKTRKYNNLFILCFLFNSVFIPVSSENQNTVSDDTFSIEAPAPVEEQYDDKPKVILQHGAIIVGNIDKTVDQGKAYYSFKGIPYAKPPIGTLRFRPPVPLPFDSGIIHAFKDGSQCVQSGLNGIGVFGSEDCLFLNVYVPKVAKNENELLPVMVWIHSSGYIVGNGGYAANGPDYFLDEDVILVTFNYRLGIFGFLSSEDKASPGNYGLKDQLLVLKWVNSHISRFGGDPGRVTLFGQSTGAVCTSYLTQTPLTEGLVHAAILQSGSSIAAWAISREPIVAAKMTADNLDIKTSNTYNLVEALRKVDYVHLQLASIKALFTYTNGSQPRRVAFTPSIEPPHPGAIIVDRSYERLRNGIYHRIPYIVGFNSREGVSFLDNPIKFIQIYSTVPRINPLTVVPDSMNIQDVRKEVQAYLDIHAHYFGLQQSPISDADLIKFDSDDQIVRPIIETAALISRYAPVYLYRFSYDGILGSGNRTLPGVGHGDELAYMWRLNFDTSTPSPSDLTTRYRLIKLWTSFAKYRKPISNDVNWHATDNAGIGNLFYLDIGKRLVQNINPEIETLRQWQKWFKHFGNPPYYTY